MNLSLCQEQVEKKAELTEVSIVYDRMLRDCNYYQGDALEQHKERMRWVEKTMNEIRARINELWLQLARNHFSDLFITNLPK